MKKASVVTLGLLVALLYGASLLAGLLLLGEFHAIRQRYQGLRPPRDKASDYLPLHRCRTERNATESDVGKI